jgi:predicted NUDIX family NTP pyrophosphohydrolase
VSPRFLRSAGILLYRAADQVEVLIGHPGGPFWANRHEGAWSIIKGIVEPGEDEQATALREFEEETGLRLEPDGMIDLGEVVLRSGKVVTAWGVGGDFDVAELRSNPVRMEWPRNSGNHIDFPEIDEVRWCRLEEAANLLNPAQVPLLARLQESLDH